MKGKKTGGRQKGTPNKHTTAVRESAIKYAHEALRVLVSLMRSKQTNEQTRFYCAQEILNRAVGRPATALTGEGGTGPAKVELTVVQEFHP